MRRQNELGGSIVGFLMACVAFAVLLVGGIYVVRHAGWFDNNTGLQVAQTNDIEKSAEKKDKSSEKSSESNDKKDKKSEKKDVKKSDKSEKKTPSKEVKKEQESAPAEKSSDKAEPNTAGSQTKAASGEPVRHLPETGPASFGLSLLGASLLTAAGVAYVRSTRL